MMEMEMQSLTSIFLINLASLFEEARRDKNLFSVAMMISHLRFKLRANIKCSLGSLFSDEEKSRENVAGDDSGFEASEASNLCCDFK
jgi:hypothetical protein